MSTRVIALAPGAAADMAAVEHVMAGAFDAKYGEAWTRSQCLGVLSLPGVWLTLARIDGEVAGIALARVAADEAELLLIAVLPAERGRGVGAALLRATMGEAAARGAVRLHLEVRAGNPAVRLYGATGFTKVGERRNYYHGLAGTFDAHSYAKDL